MLNRLEKEVFETIGFEISDLQKNDECVDSFGFLIFSKVVLVKNKILTTENVLGQRCFRLYPDWDNPTNRQAEKTKLWQSYFFFNVTKSNNNRLEKIRTVFDFK
ncbi:MepB family protein [Chryseobacterium sp. TY3]